MKLAMSAMVLLFASAVSCWDSSATDASDFVDEVDDADGPAPDTGSDGDADADSGEDAGSDADGDGDVDGDANPEVAAEWITIEPGTFLMGSPPTEPGDITFQTQHSVELTRRFQMQSTEVTQQQFQERMGYNPSRFTSCGDDCPVEQVNWHEAAAYCNALSTAEGRLRCFTCSGTGPDVACSPAPAFATPYECPGYRLPTEAEWEYAARAGTTTSTYNGDIDAAHLLLEQPNLVLDPIAWFGGNSAVTYAGCETLPPTASCQGTHPIASKLPNDWGFYDMLGNAWEWCFDWFIHYEADGTIDPWGPSAGDYRITRGGGWANDAANCRATYRAFGPPNRRDYGSGFRPVRTLP